MKKLFFNKISVLFLFALCAATLHAQTPETVDEKYNANFRKALSELDSSWVNPVRMQETANRFDRLANYKPTEWLPRYYQALCLVQLSWSATTPQERENILKGADAAIKTAATVSPDNSEIVALEGYYYQAMIMLNPMTNGAIYAPKSVATLQKAMQLDPANPRPHYLLGQNTYFTPAQWGGGMERAKPHLDKAMVLFAAYKPATEFHPNWGEVACRMILEGKMKY